MRSLAVLLMATALCGCSWSGVSRKPDGSWRAWNLRTLWATDGFEAVHGTNGTEVRLKGSGSKAGDAGAFAGAFAREFQK